MQILDLSTKPCIRGAKHWYQEINQLYHPTGEIEQDSQDLVYSYNNLNSTKFIPILLKEWFYLVKQDGYLVIDYLPNKTCNFQKLEELMWWLWKMKYDIVFHGLIKNTDLNSLTGQKLHDFIKNVSDQQKWIDEKGSCIRLVCKKLVSTKIFGDEIDKWTFGIITKGERNEWIEEIISSIRKQNIPNYEIIIAGAYFDRKENNFTYIPFRERENRGWITRQKNLIARAAKYENFCFIHDRIVFDKDWYKGMKKYGNCFELLCNKQTLRDVGIRTGDWLTWGCSALNSPYSVSKLDYTDWDEHVYMGGQLSIWKKPIWETCPWNETLYWGEEDVELTFRAGNHGYLPRFNPYSSVEALVWRFGEIPSKYYISHGLLPKDMVLRRIMRKMNKLLFLTSLSKKIFFPLMVKFVKSNVYKFLTRY